jgi:hypothetical protein
MLEYECKVSVRSGLEYPAALLMVLPLSTLHSRPGYFPCTVLYLYFCWFGTATLHPPLQTGIFPLHSPILVLLLVCYCHSPPSTTDRDTSPAQSYTCTSVGLVLSLSTLHSRPGYFPCTVLYLYFCWFDTATLHPPLQTVILPPTLL